ncbi:MAG: UDP-3-O-(3-hydroxymyristoyl)glucosamine N-acyltransferase [Spirochaetia bacterium]|nr:UDP-3-O-(3-hydroxymyristoyl)glucosamine N-acyltransferase [Spirochaetia bacterium]
MTFNTRQLFDEFGKTGLITEHRGEESTIDAISAIETASGTSLIFLDNLKFLDHVVKTKPAAIVTTAENAEKVQSLAKTIIIAPNVPLAHAIIKQRYGDRDFKNTEWGQRHPSAIVHETAQIGSEVVIGPGCVIGKNARIGKNTVVMANTVIEFDAQIGEDCVIYSGVFVGYGCKIGNRVIIQPGSVIGSEGYGFAQDSKKHSHRIPQTGIVVIEDDVRVGANNCIDRAAYAETRVGRGTKFDNLCHVAHNVQIGEDCLLTANLVVAGSTKIGNRVIASGMTGILDHLVVGDDVILVQRAGVTANVTEPGIYAGLPLQPLADYLKNQAVARKLQDMKKDISDLKKKLSERPST